MALTTRTQWAADVLINYVTGEVRTLEPDLQFAMVGMRKDVPEGFDSLVFPQTNLIPASSVSAIIPAGTGEGVNPTAIAWGAVAYKSGLTQYGIVVQVTDILVRDSAITVVDGATRQTRLALARQLDDYIQTVVEASTQANNIVYAGAKTARTSLTAGDLIDWTNVVTAKKRLDASNNAAWEGGVYWAILHGNQEADLMSNTSAGSFNDVGRYTSVENLRKGTVGDFRGVRFLRSSNVQTFSSNVTVYPCLVGGSEAFGWGYFQVPQPIIVTQADSNNPLNLYTSIGAKASIGATRFEDSSSATRLERIESAVTA